jgi:hypothetical protein
MKPRTPLSIPNSGTRADSFNRSDQDVVAAVGLGTTLLILSRLNTKKTYAHLVPAYGQLQPQEAEVESKKILKVVTKDAKARTEREFLQQPTHEKNETNSSARRFGKR